MISRAHIGLEEKALAAAEALKKRAEEAAAREAELLADKTSMAEVTEADITTTANITDASALSGVSKSGSALGKKKVVKPKMTAKERKEHEVRQITVSTNTRLTLITE